MDQWHQFNRALEALELRRRGFVFKQISEKFGVTLERARQLCERGLEIERGLTSDEPQYELSARTRNAIINSGCVPTPEAVAAFFPSMKVLQRVPSLGKKCIAELQAWLVRHDQKPVP
jgi:hypothetical protein